MTSDLIARIEAAQPGETRPKELLEAIGEMALAIKPHHMDTNQRDRIRAALTTLVDHVIAVASLKAKDASDE